MVKRNITFSANKEKIAGTIYGTDETAKADIICLHGAGTGSQARFSYLVDPLVHTGHTVLTFDFSGHGKSSGTLAESSLQKRVDEARIAIEQYGAKKISAIIGSSMGGYVAIKMLEYTSPQALILFCPGIYSKKALSVRFDQGFTEIIRQPESWVDSDAWKILSHFRGNILVIIGSADEVIPKDVITSIETNASHASKKEILWVPEAPHRIQPWLEEHPDEQSNVIQKILKTIA